MMPFCPIYSMLGHMTYSGHLNVIRTGFKLSYGRHKEEIKKQEEEKVLSLFLLFQITSLTEAASTPDCSPFWAVAVFLVSPNS